MGRKPITLPVGREKKEVTKALKVGLSTHETNTSINNNVRVVCVLGLFVFLYSLIDERFDDGMLSGDDRGSPTPTILPEITLSCPFYARTHRQKENWRTDVHTYALRPPRLMEQCLTMYLSSKKRGVSAKQGGSFCVSSRLPGVQGSYRRPSLTHSFAGPQRKKCCWTYMHINPPVTAAT